MSISRAQLCISRTILTFISLEIPDGWMVESWQDQVLPPLSRLERRQESQLSNLGYRDDLFERIGKQRSHMLAIWSMCGRAITAAVRRAAKNADLKYRSINHQDIRSFLLGSWRVAILRQSCYEESLEMELT